MGVAVVLAACSSDATGPIVPEPVEDTVVPAIPREFRGMWIATVANIDWPSRSGLSDEQQKAELIDLLDRAAALRINAVVFHVRPAADAVYQSSIEPWALMLTGTQGVGPGYDPLAFAIQEAHARGMQLHAWINPFRAGNTRDTAQLAANHVYKSQRDLVRVYGANLWLDPGEPAAHEHSMRVIRDIVTRYDIDALHADDYFYPYPETQNGSVLAFPDDATFARLGGGMARADWRRDNINRFVQRMYNEVHALKPTLKVGISPFGIWRPGNPAGIVGLDAYASIYADSRKWLQEGWVDYLAPQLYWAISPPQQSFPALLDWWLAQNARGRHVWPGLAAYRVGNGTSSAFTIQEIPNQIATVRARNAGGQLLYNATWTLKQNSAQLANALMGDAYKTGAVVPATPWLDNTAPPAPTVSASGNTLSISTNAADVRWWVLHMKSGTEWTVRTQFGTNRTFTIPANVSRIRVHAADMTMNLSAAAEWKR